MDAIAMAREQRSEMADFLASLRPDQWNQPGLCAGWRVRDVAAHVVSYEKSDWGDMMRGVGVRLVATDLDWSRGKGPEARGPSEAVLMVLAGRRGLARELSGPGVAILERRLG